MLTDEILLKKLAKDIEKEWAVTGLSTGITFDFVMELIKRFCEVISESIVEIKEIEENI